MAKEKLGVLQQRKECYFWRTICDMEVTHGLELHHIYGGANRKISDKNGFFVYLTKANHTGANCNDNPLGVLGVHFNRDFDLKLKRACQREFEKTHTRQDFMRLIGKNYLED